MRNLIIGILITICGSYGNNSLDSNWINYSPNIDRYFFSKEKEKEIITNLSRYGCPSYKNKISSYIGKGTIQLIFGLGCLVVSYVEPSILYNNEWDDYHKSKNLTYEALEFNVNKPKWGKGRWGYILIGTFTGIALTCTGITDLYIGYNPSNKLVEIKKEISFPFDKM